MAIDFEALLARARAKGDGGEIRHWKPQPGEGIAGVLVSRGKIPTKYGPKSYVLLETENGQRVRVILSSKLEDQLAGAREGQAVAIVYHGKDGKYHMYSTAVGE